MAEPVKVEQSNQEAKEEPDMIEKAEKAAAILKEQLDRMEKLQSRQLMAGKSLTGVQPEQPHEETPQEYRKRVERGDYGKTTRKI